jgi:hypothetical protein
MWATVTAAESREDEHVNCKHVMGTKLILTEILGLSVRRAINWRPVRKLEDAHLHFKWRSANDTIAVYKILFGHKISSEVINTFNAPISFCTYTMMGTR